MEGRVRELNLKLQMKMRQRVKLTAKEKNSHQNDVTLNSVNYVDVTKHKSVDVTKHNSVDVSKHNSVDVTKNNSVDVAKHNLVDVLMHNSVVVNDVTKPNVVLQTPGNCRISGDFFSDSGVHTSSTIIKSARNSPIEAQE